MSLKMPQYCSFCHFLMHFQNPTMAHNIVGCKRRYHAPSCHDFFFLCKLRLNRKTVTKHVPICTKNHDAHCLLKANWILKSSGCHACRKLFISWIINLQTDPKSVMFLKPTSTAGYNYTKKDANEGDLFKMLRESLRTKTRPSATNSKTNYRGIKLGHGT